MDDDLILDYVLGTYPKIDITFSYSGSCDLVKVVTVTASTNTNQSTVDFITSLSMNDEGFAKISRIKFSVNGIPNVPKAVFEKNYTDYRLKVNGRCVPFMQFSRESETGKITKLSCLYITLNAN
jgi:hypothetical protein